MPYTIDRTIEDADFEAVDKRARQSLTDNCFGVLIEIDVKTTMKEKLGTEIPAYRIFGHAILGHRRGASSRGYFAIAGALSDFIRDLLTVIKFHGVCSARSTLIGYPDYLVGMRERKVADKLNPQRISWLMARSVRSLAREQILHQTGDAQEQQQ